MKWHRIYGIILRYMYLFRHSFDRLSDTFYWPLIDLLLWGLTSTYLRKVSPNTPQIVVMILAGLILWFIVWRSQYELTVGLLEDLWNKNFVNIFVAPLQFKEWVSALIILGILKAAISISFASVLAYLLYKMNIFALGFSLLPFVLLLFMTGWWIGFLVTGLIMRIGTRVQTFAWTMAYVISPFSAVYYPVETLPKWAQYVAMITPTSYVFEGAREVLDTGILDWNKVLISFLLSSVYIILTFLFFKKSFEKVLQKGLVNLY